MTPLRSTAISVVFRYSVDQRQRLPEHASQLHPRRTASEAVEVLIMHHATRWCYECSDLDDVIARRHAHVMQRSGASPSSSRWAVKVPSICIDDGGHRDHPSRLARKYRCVISTEGVHAWTEGASVVVLRSCIEDSNRTHRCDRLILSCSGTLRLARQQTIALSAIPQRASMMLAARPSHATPPARAQ
jgi:hypothetical protein